MKKWLLFFKESLKWKAVLIFFLLFVLPASMIGLLISMQSNHVLKQQILDTTHNNLDHMEAKLTTVIDDVEEISSYIIFSEEFRTFMTLSTDQQEEYNEIRKLKKNISGFFAFHLSEKDYFNSVTINGMNGESIQVGEPMYGDESTWLEKAAQSNGNIIWSDPYVMASSWMQDDKKVITLFRKINNIHTIVEPIGTAKIRLDANELFKYVAEGFTPDQQEAFFLFDGDEVITEKRFSLEDSIFSNGVLKDKLRMDQEDFKFTSSGQTYYGVSKYIDRMNLYLVSVTNEDYILSKTAGIRTTFKFVIFIVAFMGICVFLGFVFTVIKPILELTSETKKLESGDFSARVKTRTTDEIGQLGYRFNQMVSQIDRLIAAKYKLEIQHKESELKVLQNQVDPHFLYNTLDMIRWTARLEQAKETEKNINELSTLFRISLSEGKAWISLQEEMNYVQSYLMLMKRRTNRLNFLVMMEAGLEHKLMMKFILQPLVENSMKHAFKHNQREKVIRVRAYKSEDDIVMDVIDNGSGMEVDQMNSFIERTLENDREEGVGMKNVHDRIITAFGKPYGLKVIAVDQGSLIRIHIPMIDSMDQLKRLLKSGEK